LKTTDPLIQQKQAVINQNRLLAALYAIPVRQVKVFPAAS